MSSAQGSTDRDRLLARIKALLQDAFKERFQGVVLYGSEARGEAREDSDIDLVVLLTGPIKLWKDIYAATWALYDLQLELDRLIHVLPVDVSEFHAGEYSFYRTLKEEGVFA